MHSTPSREEILALAKRVALTAAYTPEDLGTEGFHEHGSDTRDEDVCVILVKEQHRALIATALVAWSTYHD